MNNISQNKKPKLLLLDLASEKNRGDAAMQVSLIDLIKKYFPEADFSVSTVFGVNQYPECLAEFDHTYRTNNATFFGGLSNTYEVFGEGVGASNPLIIKLKKLGTLLLSFVFLGSMFLRIPSGVIKVFLSPQKRESLTEIKNTDFVLWNGRNFRSYSFLKEPIDIFQLCFHPLVCILLKKPIVCLGASVWELKNPISRLILSFVFSHCALVTLREESSYTYIKNLLQAKQTNVRLRHVPDLSLHMLQRIAVEKRESLQQLTFSMTIVGEREIGEGVLFDAYIRQMRDVVQYLTEEMKAKIVVVPQVVFAPESNERALQSIFSGIPKEAYVCLTNFHDVTQLVERYAQCDFLIATRMHSAIFALTAGTPVLAIAYDYGAKWNILRDMGLSDESIMDMPSLHSENLRDRFKYAWENRHSTLAKVQDTLKTKVYPEIDIHFQEVRSLFEKDIR